MANLKIGKYGWPEEAHELYLDPKLFPMAGEGPRMKFIDVRA